VSSVPKVKNEIVISPTTINTLQIAQYFNIDIKKLNKIFLELQWIRRKYFLWLVTTELGESRGAKKERREILWNRNILGDTELILAIKRTLTDFEEVDPALYRSKVQKKYQESGYTVWDYTKEKGSYDRDIHLVVKKDREVILIHCRNSEEDISLEEVLTFRKSKQVFLEENPVFSIYSLKLHYTMLNFSLTEEAFEYIKEHKEKISYELLK
jgi:hypothetical protein